MLTVNAYAAPSATEPLAPTTIERRDVGPHDVLIEIKYAGICHSDIHTVRGDWGPQHLPAGSRPRNRRHRHRGRLGRHQARRRRPGRRRLHGQLLRRVRQLPGRRGAVLPQREHRHLRRRRPRRHHHPGRLLHPRRRDRRLRGHASPRASSSTSPRRCCAPASPPTRRCNHWGAGPGKKVADRRPRRTRPHGRQDRPRHGRRGHRPLPVAEEAGRRAEAWARTTTTPPATREHLRRTLPAPST